MSAGVLIRPVRVEDVGDLDVVRRQPGVIDGTLNIPSERLLDRRRRLETLGPNVREFVAEVDGRVVASAELAAFQGRMSHAGEIADIVVHDDFQGRGIGRRLLEALLDGADNALGLVRVELLVYVRTTPPPSAITRASASSVKGSSASALAGGDGWSTRR
jgi:putative acetyltransferase